MYVEQVFFSESHVEKGRHVVIQKEPSSRQGEGNTDSAPEVQLLSLGNDNDFADLIPATIIRDEALVAPNLANEVPLTASKIATA